MDEEEADDDGQQCFDNDQSENAVQEKRGRLANPASWKKNQRKANRNKGAEYTSSKGKKVAPRSIKELGVDCPCKLKCSSKISHEGRQGLFNSFWAMGDLHRQRDYLGTMVKVCAVSRKRAKTSMKRNITMNYSFSYDNTIHRVCKPFFLNTLGINYGMIKTALVKGGSNNHSVTG